MITLTFLETFATFWSVNFCLVCTLCFFFFNDTATTEIYTLSLHDALPISPEAEGLASHAAVGLTRGSRGLAIARSEEHTSELQSLAYLVCRLLLEKKKMTKSTPLLVSTGYWLVPALLESVSSQGALFKYLR